MSEVAEEPGGLADVEAEGKAGKIAGALVFVAVVMTLSAAPLSTINGPDLAGKTDDQKRLLAIGLGQSGQLLGLGAAMLGLLLLIPAVFLLFFMCRARNAEAYGWVPWLGAVGMVMVSVALPLSFFELHHAAHVYVDSGARTAARAKSLIHHQTVPSDIIKVVGSLIYGFWISSASTEAQRVGLLSRFLGVFGIGAGVLTVVGGFSGLPIGQALFIGWIGSVAVLMLGYWPGGRPPAWEEGRAVPWEEYDARDAGRLDRSAR